MMRKPDVISGYEYHGHVDVQWYDISSKKDIPDLQWDQVYVVGNYQGKVPVVEYVSASDSLPGGRAEPGESLEQTLIREIQEETNLHVVDWQPIGYQICTHRETGEVSNQFRAYAMLDKIDEFTDDPGGSVIGYKLVELDALNDYVDYGLVGERLIAGAKQYFATD